MKIDEIYQHFRVPTNLKEHMFRVFGIVCVFELNWNGEKQDWNLLKKLALLHDLGNIVKFNLRSDELSLKEVQKTMIDKYGSDDHEATGKMIKELGFSDEAVETVAAKSFGNSISIANSSNFLLKILYYADMRVLPNGIGTLEERLIDVKNRMPKYSSRSDFEDLLNASRDIEKQLQERTTQKLSTIDERMIAPPVLQAATFEI